MLKKIYAQYGGRNFDIVGVNLDYSRDDLVKYLRASRLPWKQLYEEGGYESRLANEMGIVTLPMLVLVDPDGQVVSTTLQTTEVEAELKKLLAEEVASKR